LGDNLSSTLKHSKRGFICSHFQADQGSTRPGLLSNDHSMKIRILLFLSLLVPISSCSNRRTEKSQDMDIYLLIGQSNMAGRASIDEAFSDTLPGVYLLSPDTLNLWEPAANPLNKYSSISKRIEMQKMGPGYSFAKQLRKQNPGREIGLVVNARGGTSIFKWTPGTSYYNEAVSRTNVASEYGKLKGVLWLQGESDVSRIDRYMDTLIYLINSLRMEFDEPYLPFIASELSEDKSHRIPFNEMIRKLPEKLEYTGVISASGTITIDSTHFDSKSQVILGERFADKILELQK